jgi:hypothetical protein
MLEMSSLAERIENCPLPDASRSIWQQRKHCARLQSPASVGAEMASKGAMIIAASERATLVEN